MTLGIRFLFAVLSLTVQVKNDACVQFRQNIASVYNFKPSQLTDQQRSTKSAEMDRIWNQVKARPQELVPCLQATLEDPQANNWFLFDGSSLLASVAPSPAARALQLRALEAVDLSDVQLSVWMAQVIRLALLDVDVTRAAERWLDSPSPSYFIPLHSLTVNKDLGAIFLYGSMNEAQATPALIRIASRPGHAGREAAVRVLIDQATPEAWAALRSMDVSWLPQNAQQVVRQTLTDPPRIEARPQPKTTRASFVSALQAFVDGKPDAFLKLQTEVPDGERDFVAVMRPEDVPLIRKIRRLRIGALSDEGLDDYQLFTGILYTMLWKP